MTEQIQSERSDEEIFKDHIDNLYQLFDPKREKTQEELISFSKQPIQCLYVLLAFVINTRSLVQLQDITDKFVEEVIKSFSVEDQQLRTKLVDLDKQIKACCFSGKKFEDCALFFSIWSEILEQFVQDQDNAGKEEQTSDL